MDIVFKKKAWNNLSTRIKIVNFRDALGLCLQDG